VHTSPGKDALQFRPSCQVRSLAEQAKNKTGTHNSGGRKRPAKHNLESSLLYARQTSTQTDTESDRGKLFSNTKTGQSHALTLFLDIQQQQQQAVVPTTISKTATGCSSNDDDDSRLQQQQQ
jgi:hypothetical protein